MEVHTEVPGRMNRDAISRQKEKMCHDSQSRPMAAKTWVVGAAYGSMGTAESILFTPWGNNCVY